MADEFKKLDLERARKALTHPIMFDGRNLFDAAGDGSSSGLFTRASDGNRTQGSHDEWREH